MFTLTVPASFVGQSLRLCLQASHGKALCHNVKINRGATVAVPVLFEHRRQCRENQEGDGQKSGSLKKATSNLAILSKAGVKKK